MANRTGRPPPTAPGETKRIELAVGVVGIIVGLAGIYFTVLGFPSALDAVGSVLTGAGLPPGFKGLAGGLTLFIVILTGLIALGALFVGLMCLCELIYHFLGAPIPRRFGFVTALILFWFATGITVYMYSSEAAFAVGMVGFLGVGMVTAMVIVTGLNL